MLTAVVFGFALAVGALWITTVGCTCTGWLLARLGRLGRLGYIHLVLVLLNMIPGFPTDGAVSIRQTRRM